MKGILRATISLLLERLCRAEHVRKLRASEGLSNDIDGGTATEQGEGCHRLCDTFHHRLVSECLER